MLDEVASSVISVARSVLTHLVWEILLFNLGRGSLLFVTLGRYPRGRVVETHANRISLAGLVVVALVWVGVVFYNRFVGN